MKYSQHISDQFSGLHGQDPKGCECFLANGIVEKRCLYQWVS